MSGGAGPVTIVMPVHNALAAVAATLRALDATCPEVPLVLVDDASGPETAAYLREYHVECQTHRDCQLLVNARQQLFTRTVNRGLRVAWASAQPATILVLNSDVALAAGWLAGLMAVWDKSPRSVGMVGYPDVPDGKPPLVTRVRLPEYVTGHCMLLNTRMLAEIGVLTETDTTGRDSPELAGLLGQAHIGSDRLLSWRANMAGWETWTVNKPCIRHVAGQSWQHDLAWLACFELVPLWPAHDALTFPVGWEEE